MSRLRTAYMHKGVAALVTMAATVNLQRSQSAMPRRPGTSVARPFTASKPRRPYSAYTQRGAEEQGQRFDAPETNREWWRHYVKETPSPGAYRLGDFVEDMRKKHTTYGFRNTGRRPQSASAASAHAGETLLPGAYEHKDFLEQSFRRSMAYSFRAIDRDSGPKIGHGYGDKELDTSPTWFDLRAAEAAVIAKERNMTDSNFKSRVNRFPSPAFPILEGPGPGQYEAVKTHNPATISSSFRSKTPRFNNRLQKVPGPGTYNTAVSDFGEPKPLPAAVHHIRKKHGIAVT